MEREKIRITKQDVEEAENRLKQFIRTHHRQPNFLSIRNMDTGETQNITPTEYNYLYWATYNFWNRNSRYPNWTTLNNTRVTPQVLIYQSNSSNCGPASMSMISTKLFQPVTEKTFVSSFGTNWNGTPPERIINGANRHGFKVTRIGRNMNSVKIALDEGAGVLCHYETGAARCSGFRQNYGHYASIDRLDGHGYVVYDPTKGIFSCDSRMLDSATNGRDIGYYRVDLI